MSEFRDSAPSAPAVFYRSYSRRKPNGERESFREAVTRAINDLADIGGLTQEQRDLCLEMGLNQYTLPSGRALWVAGTDWAKKPDNFPGYYNCCSLQVEHLGIFGLLMELAMMGVGTGAVLEKEVVDKLPPVSRQIEIIEVVENSTKQGGKATTKLEIENYVLGNVPVINLVVGDSRQGWASGFQALIDLACGSLTDVEKDINCNRAFVKLDLSQIRQAGERLKGFGGVANPVRLRATFENVAEILAGAYGRGLTPIECCLLIDEAASAVVAGNVRRCLPGSALVHTVGGLIPIKDVRIGDLVQTSKGLRPIKDKFEQGIQRLVEIKTQDGSFYCSREHKVAVLNSIYGDYVMVKAKDLAVDDRMIGNHFTVEGIPTELPEAKELNSLGKKPLKDIKIPALTEDVAYFIGYYHGNGDTSGSNRVRICVPSGLEKLLDRLLCTARLFCFDAKVYPVKGKKAVCIELNGKTFNAYFRQFKKPGGSPTIPDCILRGLPETRWAYLAGLMDSDGAPSTHSLLSSSRPKFARQVQIVYSSLGVPVRMEKRDRRGAQECELNAVGLYKHVIHEVFSRIGTRYPLLSTTPTAKSRNQHGFPRSMVKSAVTDLGWSNQETQKTVVTLKEIEPAVCDLIPVKVLEVIDTGRDELTYDIEVEDIHEFYCDGYLVSNSAGMKQFSWDDQEAAVAKEGLYRQNEDGSWSVDPKKEALRMSNHTRCYHHKPSYEEIEDAVTKQYYSGEGAIQYVPEMVARANADLLDTVTKKQVFIDTYIRFGKIKAKECLRNLAKQAGEPTDDKVIDHRITRYGLNPCGEIALRDNLCNLSEVNVNVINPGDLDTQAKAFYAAGLQVASLLQHKFVPPELAYSRQVDPIVGVGLTGGFDFFVHLFGASWLGWMMRGRPAGKEHKFYSERERYYLSLWRQAAEAGVRDYCKQAGIRVPNRCTDLQPSGSKSLLTGASPGWHPPKAQRFIRRITFGKHDPLVAALRDYGYSVIPAQSARDDEGNLLDDVNDPRVQEVLVEIPTEVSWANLPGCDQFDLAKLPIEAQWGFYMQFQNYYTTHNTSATLEFREHEIPLLSKLIYDNIQEDGGYISAALLARFDANETFPRLPFEPINKETYDRMMAKIKAYRVTLPADVTILDLLKPYDHPDHVLEPQDTACANAACLAKVEQDEARGLT